MDPNQDILGPTNYYEKKITDTPIVSGYIETTNDEYDTNVEIIIKDDDGNTLGSDNLNSDGTFAVEIEFAKGGSYPIYAYCGDSVTGSDGLANMTVYYLRITGYNMRNYYPNAGSSLILSISSNYDDSTLGNMSIYLNGGLFSSSAHKGDYEITDEFLNQIGHGGNIVARVVSSAVNLENSVTLTGNPNNVTISLSANYNNIAYGDTVTLSGILSIGSGQSVKIYEGNTLLGTVTTTSGGIFEYTTNSLTTIGSHTYKAVFPGDDIYPSKTSSNVVVTVAKKNPTLTIAAPDWIPYVGSSTNFNITGLLKDGNTALTNTAIKVYVNNTLKTTLNTDSNGQITYNVTECTDYSTMTVKLIYDGDNTFADKEATANVGVGAHVYITGVE